MESSNFFRNKRGIRTLRVESLETRSLLSADLFHAAAAVHHHGETVQVGPVLPSHASVASHTTSSQSQTHSETRMVASLAAPNGTSTAKGTAAYESETEHGKTSAQLFIKVSGGTPNATLPISIDSSSLAVQITLDANGNGRLKITSGLPAIQSGTTVAVDTLTGSLAVPAKPPVNAGPGNGRTHSETETKLSSLLADPSGTDLTTGKVSYESSQEHGQTHTELTVRVKGATPKAQLNVVVIDRATNASTTVGTITVDANGNGELEVSAGLPVIQAGWVVNVGTAGVTGTLA